MVQQQLGPPPNVIIITNRKKNIHDDDGTIFTNSVMCFTEKPFETNAAAGGEGSIFFLSRFTSDEGEKTRRK
jgi:hypothetical protein